MMTYKQDGRFQKQLLCAAEHRVTGQRAASAVAPQPVVGTLRTQHAVERYQVSATSTDEQNIPRFDTGAHAPSDRNVVQNRETTSTKFSWCIARGDAQTHYAHARTARDISTERCDTRAWAFLRLPTCVPGASQGRI